MPTMPKEYRDKWYEKNKEKHLDYCKEKIKCECGKNVCRSSLSKHKETKLHKKKTDEILSKEKELTDKIIIEVLKVRKEVEKIEKIELDIDKQNGDIIDIKLQDEKNKKCDKCDFSGSPIEYRNHFVSNRHKFSKYMFDEPKKIN